jgi:hypothetical protein
LSLIFTYCPLNSSKLFALKVIYSQLGSYVGGLVIFRVGSLDGMDVGKLVDLVGDMVGIVVGDCEGTPVGDALGCLLGTAVGLLVGNREGLVVGFLVGDGVGLEVGGLVAQLIDTYTLSAEEIAPRPYLV